MGDHSLRSGLLVLMFVLSCAMVFRALALWGRTDKYRARAARHMERGDTAGAEDLVDEAHFERSRAVNAAFAAVGGYLVTGGLWAISTWVWPTLIATQQ